MPGPTRGDLLQPTLTGRLEIQALYSQRAGYLTSFFGGPLAGAIITGVNARRLGRLSKDAWLVALGAVLGIGMLWWQIRFGGNAWLDSVLGQSGHRLAPRIAGLAYFLVTIAVHRPFYRNMEMAGIESPNGWPMGIMAIIFSSLILAGLAVFFVM